MNFAINATYKAGGGQISQLINLLYYSNYYSKDGSNNIFVFITERNLQIIKSREIDLSNLVIIKCILPNISTLFRVLWEQIIFPLLLIKRNIKVVFFPGNISLFFFKSINTVQWIGTIGPFWDEMYDYEISKLKFKMNKYFMYKTAELADKVIFESNYTKNFFINNYNISDQKCEVLNIGKDINYYHEVDNRILKKFGINDPFILCVSHFYPYKNLERMVEAFDIVRQKTKTDINLYIAGEIVFKKYYNKVINVINKRGLKNSIKILGLADQKELRTLYSSARFLISPSPCENFAYTLVEAMSCRTPIVCANTTAMPETCGDAAIYFDPKNIHEMSNSMIKLISDDELREELVVQSSKRVDELPDYEEVFNETINIINKL